MLHFSICACHPCAGAMLIFSISFQFYRMIPEGNPLGSEQKRCLPCSSRHHQCHGWPFTIDIPLLAFFRPGLCPNVLHSAAVSSGSSMPHMHMPQSTLGSGIPLTRLSWAEARVKIARMTLTGIGVVFSPRSYPTHPLTLPFALAFNYLSLSHFTTPISFRQQ